MFLMMTTRIFPVSVAIIAVLSLLTPVSTTYYDNAIVGIPEVQCMEDRMRLTFRTARPFTGRVFVKGMVDKDQCVNSFIGNTKAEVQYEMTNGQCNMRRSRKISSEQKGVEQSLTIIVSFHDTFITKVDRAFRCTCFYMEADRVVTARFDVSMIPTTDLVDTARMPICTYTVRRGSVTGPTVAFATVGEPVFHVWQCESDMFSMLVHSCFVDDGNGQEKKPLIDERGCAIEPTIVPDLIYNDPKNVAYSELNVFKFADKVTTYFQCAVSTCMRSEGMCSGKTPPRCGYAQPEDLEPEIAEGVASADVTATTERTAVAAAQKFRKLRSIIVPISSFFVENNRTSLHDDGHTMDLSTDKIVVLDLDEQIPRNNTPSALTSQLESQLLGTQSWFVGGGQFCLNSFAATLLSITVGLFLIVVTSALLAVPFRRKFTQKLPL